MDDDGGGVDGDRDDDDDGDRDDDGDDADFPGEDGDENVACDGADHDYDTCP